MEKRPIRRNKRKMLKKKPCYLCSRGIYYVDYKDVELLKHYLTPSCKIVPRRVSGLCQKHQRMIANAIKRARIVALLPFVKQYE